MKSNVNEKSQNYFDDFFRFYVNVKEILNLAIFFREIKTKITTFYLISQMVNPSFGVFYSLLLSRWRVFHNEGGSIVFYGNI